MVQTAFHELCPPHTGSVCCTLPCGPTLPHPCSTRSSPHLDPGPEGRRPNQLAAVTHGGSGTAHRWSQDSPPIGGVSSRGGRRPQKRGGGVRVWPSRGVGGAHGVVHCALCRLVYSLGLRVKPLSVERGRVRVRDVCKPTLLLHVSSCRLAVLVCCVCPVQRPRSSGTTLPVCTA